MKTLLLTLCYAFGVAFSLFSQTSNGIPLPTRITTKAGTPSGIFTNATQDTYFYNADSTLSHELNDIWDTTTNTWLRNTQVFYTYDAEGRLIENLNQMRQPDSTWVNVIRKQFSYYPDPAYLGGQPRTEERQFWNTSNQWETFQLYTNTAFGPNDGALEGELSEKLFQGFGAQLLGDFVKYTWEVTPAGNRISSLIYKGLNASTGTYDNAGLEVYVYNDALSLEFDTINNFGWIEAGMNWDTAPNGRIIQTHNGNERVQVTENFFSEWVKNSRSTFITNQYDQLEVYKFDVWNWDILDFKGYSRTETSYNANHSIATVSSYGIDFSVPEYPLFHDKESIYEYGAFTATHSPLYQGRLIVFPNPTTDIVQLSMDSWSDIPFTLVDTKGRIAARGVVRNKMALVSLAGQPTGAYFLRVEQDGIIKVVPVVKY